MGSVGTGGVKAGVAEGGRGGPGGRSYDAPGETRSAISEGLRVVAAALEREDRELEKRTEARVDALVAERLDDRDGALRTLEAEQLEALSRDLREHVDAAERRLRSELDRLAKESRGGGERPPSGDLVGASDVRIEAALGRLHLGIDRVEAALTRIDDAERRTIEAYEAMEE